jgi:D-threonate/D-erythronate kinase
MQWTGYLAGGEFTMNGPMRAKPDVQVLAIADDTTGALEVGAQFAMAGVRSLVSSANALLAGTCALVLNTETRQVTPEGAGRRVASLAGAARDAGIRYLYKKTDSTLRGNIASEFQALLNVFPERFLVYVPAYPKMGRVVKGGELYVDGLPLAPTGSGKDPAQQSRDGSIPSLLARGSRAPVLLATASGQLEGLLRDAAPGSIVVCDGTTEEDLEAAAAAVSLAGEDWLVAGTGGFSGHWIRRLPVERNFARRRPNIKRCLVVSGSRHPASREQVEQASDGGIASIWLGENPDTDAATVFAAAAALAARDWALLRTPGTGPPGVSERLGVITGRVLASQPVDGLIIFVGSTAYAVLRAIGVTVVEPLGELLAGVAVSVARYRNRDLVLITKAGGFGDAGSLVSILGHLEKEP